MVFDSTATLHQRMRALQFPPTPLVFRPWFVRLFPFLWVVFRVINRYSCGEDLVENCDANPLTACHVTPLVPICDLLNLSRT